MSKASFKKRLAELLNSESMEGRSNTPDFILAEYLTNCLEVFESITRVREIWCGRDPAPMPNEPQLEPDL